MNVKKIASILSPALIAVPLSVSAEEDLRALVKAMSPRMAELEAKLAKLEQDKARTTVAAPSGHPTPVQTATIAIGTAPASEAHTKAAAAVTVDDANGTFKRPGANTSLGFGGHKLGDQHLALAQIRVGNAVFNPL